MRLFEFVFQPWRPWSSSSLSWWLRCWRPAVRAPPPSTATWPVRFARSRDAAPTDGTIVPCRYWARFVIATTFAAKIAPGSPPTVARTIGRCAEAPNRPLFCRYYDRRRRRRSPNVSVRVDNHPGGHSYHLPSENNVPLFTCVLYTYFVYIDRAILIILRTKCKEIVRGWNWKMSALLRVTRTARYKIRRSRAVKIKRIFCQHYDVQCWTSSNTDVFLFRPNNIYIYIWYSQ